MKLQGYKIMMFVLIGVLFLSVSSVCAETMILKSGKTVEGKIAEKTDKYIKIDFQGVPLTYYLDEIESIDGVKQAQSLTEENKSSQENNLPSVHTETAEEYFNRGDVYAKQGNFTQAISDYTKSIEINPKDAKVYNNRGNAYSKQGKFSQAISDFTKAIEINPNFVEAYSGRGNTYVKQGNFPQAISDCTKSIEINPNHAGAYSNRGNAYAKQGNFPQAISDYTKSIKINPNHAGAYSNRGIAYYTIKEYNKAWIDVHKAEELGHVVNHEFLNELKTASGRSK